MLEMNFTRDTIFQSTIELTIGILDYLTPFPAGGYTA